MKTFLEHVASSLLQRFGSNLSRVTVVFPGKRASLFLNQALAEQSSTPVWAPRYLTISELFQQASPLALADPIESVCRLHAAYARHIQDPQPLDRFWSWGEILLSDFDDLDKHLVDAASLFTNIADLHALDDNSYITPEQEEALRAFFRNFSLEENSQIKQQFLRLWEHMGDIYSDLHTSMRRDGVLYEGALQRSVVEQLRQARLAGDDSEEDCPLFTTDQRRQMTYAFVGFNVLNDVEQALFDELQARQQALFFWDYDTFYVDHSHEAGHFLRRNLQRYGNELPADCFDNLRQPKQIELVSASSENAQARFVPQWLGQHLTPRENRTAVVLCNEQLLQPVLHSIPSDGKPEAVNITMGFPLADTPVFSFVVALISLQTEGYDVARQRFRSAQLRIARRHPFARLLDEQLWCHPVGEGPALLSYLLECLTALAPHFSEDSTDIAAFYRQLYVEALFRTFTAISRLLDLMTSSSSPLTVSDHTLRRLLRSILQSQSVPFHGEPATGLQVMGVLETRALDFDNLLMLSVGEGFLPKTSSDTSLIPYNLREAFGLTTVRHKMAVYAYYFYRLIQRARHITFVYNESNAGTRQNEPSRFLRQLLAETDFPITAQRLQAPTKVITAEPIVIQKTPEILHWLHSSYDLRSQQPGEKAHVLSPTAINTYTTCPLSFYFRYVRQLTTEFDPEEFNAVLFGLVFHKAAQLVFQKLTSAGDIVRAQDIEPLLENRGIALESIISQAFREEYFHDRPEEYSGILIIARHVLQTYLLQLLKHDLKLTPLRIIGLEKWYEMQLTIGDIEVRTGGIIDRLDEVQDPAVEGGRALRVVDYKTGGTPGAVNEMQQLFAQAGQREHYYLQTILYATIVATKQGLPVTPCLFYVHRSGADDYSPKLRLARQQLNDVRPLQEEFLQQLSDVIAHIFDPQIPFTQTQNTQSCQNCDFAHLCGR